jgi:flotillin
VKKQADAERYRVETEAAATRQKAEQVARGEAEATRQKGLAQADVIKATGSSEAEIIALKGSAEAEAMRKKADSWKEYNQAAVLQLLLQALPDIAKAIAEPLSKTDKITLVSTGGEGTGASRLTGDIAKVMSEIPAVVEALSGVDLRKLMEAIPALKAASGGPGTGDRSK